MRLEDMIVITQYIHLCIENMKKIEFKRIKFKTFQKNIDFVHDIMLLTSIPLTRC